AARSHRLVPVVGMPERVQLDQVDVVHAKPLERAVDVLAALLGGPRAGLRREEEILPVTRHPRCDAQLGVAVPRRRVEVVAAVRQGPPEGPAGVGLARTSQRGGAEERDAAEMAGSSEWTPLDHHWTSVGRSLEVDIRRWPAASTAGHLNRALFLWRCV